MLLEQMWIEAERALTACICHICQDHRQTCCMCIDICVDMCIDMCIDMCVDMCVNMCVDLCLDMCLDMCLDLCMDMCMDTDSYMCTMHQNNILTANIVMAYVVISCIVTIFAFMANNCGLFSYGLYSYDLCCYGLYNHGLYSYGRYSSGLYRYGLHSYGAVHRTPYANDEVALNNNVAAEPAASKFAAASARCSSAVLLISM